MAARPTTAQARHRPRQETRGNAPSTSLLLSKHRSPHASAFSSASGSLGRCLPSAPRAAASARSSSARVRSTETCFAIVRRCQTSPAQAYEAQWQWYDLGGIELVGVGGVEGGAARLLRVSGGPCFLHESSERESEVNRGPPKEARGSRVEVVEECVGTRVSRRRRCLLLIGGWVEVG